MYGYYCKHCKKWVLSTPEHQKARNSLCQECFDKQKSERPKFTSRDKIIISTVSQWLQDNGFEEASKAIDCEFEI